MNFFSLLIYCYLASAGLTVFFIGKTLILKEKRRIAKFDAPVWLLRKKWHRAAGWTIVAILLVGILAMLDARFVEPNILITKTFNYKINKLNKPITIAFVADLQVGNHKKTAWTEKVVKAVEKMNPDLVLFGGDQVDNEGRGLTDETEYLEPLRELATKYPSYYILGNHEYGAGSATQNKPNMWAGDESREEIARMEKLGIKLLRNNLVCPEIKKQKICIFGLDDIWGGPSINFDELTKWDKKIPLIYLAHNPDGILYWPPNIKKPDLQLSGHTHGGQIYLPLVGPLGNAGVMLGDEFYRGLNYYQGTPIFTSFGAGESGGPTRFLTLPEIVRVKLTLPAK